MPSSCTVTSGGSRDAVTGRRVVALGGGHGLATSLTALKILTDHVTAVFGVPATRAPNVLVAEMATVAAPGLTVTAMGGAVSVTVASANWTGLATEVARTLMADATGMAAGAK